MQAMEISQLKDVKHENVANSTTEHTIALLPT